MPPSSVEICPTASGNCPRPITNSAAYITIRQSKQELRPLFTTLRHPIENPTAATGHEAPSITDSTSTTMHHEPSNTYNAYSRFIAAGIAMLMIIGGLLIWAWNGPGAALAKSAPPFVLERQDNGSWPEVPKDSAGLIWTMDASKSKRTTTSKPIGYSTSDNGARVASRSIAVLNMSTTPFADLVARGVIAGLQADPQIQRIAYTPKNRHNPPGEIAPDITITITADEYYEDTATDVGTTNSKVTVTMSDQVARGLSTTTSKKHAPYRVKFLTTFTSDSVMEQESIATPNARITAAAAGQSDDILDRIRDSLSSLRKRYGIFPELPATFYPNYIALDESQFDIRTVFADNESFHQLSSWRDRLVHNRTWWHGLVAGNKGTAMARIGGRLQEAGFTRNNPTDRLDHTFSKGSLEVELINNEALSTDVISSDEKPADNLMTKLHVSYTHRADEGMRLAALDSVITNSVITNNQSTDLLMMCSPGWSKEQRMRGNALIETIDLQDPSHLMRRAAMRHQAKNVKGTIADLCYAVIRSMMIFRHDTTLNDARKQAEEWGITFEDKLNDREWLLSIGATELTIAAEPIEFEVTADKPFHGVTFIDGQATTIAVGLTANKQGKWGVAVHVTGNSNSIQSGMLVGRSRHRLDEFTVTTETLDDPSDGQSRVRLQIH